MAFSVRDLSVLAYANGFTLWHYKAAASGLADAVQPNFFNPAADLLATGDMMLVSSPRGGRILTVATFEDRVVAAPLG